MSTRTSAPLPMRPAGISGRVFGWLMEWTNASAYRLALDMLAPARDEAMVEIGFGTGRMIELLAARMPAGRVAGIDPTETMLDVARNRRGVRGAGERIDLRLGDASHLPWPDAAFDGAAALHSFQFWSDPLAGLGEVRRVLRSGGRFVLILRAHDPTRPPAWLPNPISRGPDEVAGTRAALAAAGFVVQNRERGWPDHALRAVKP